MAKEENQEELENVEVQIEQAEEFVKKNKNILFGAVAVVAAIAVGLVFYSQNKDEQNKQAQLDIYPAQYYFGQDSLDIVLNGDGNNVVGVEELAEDYSGSNVGNLANFYAGVTHLKKGNFQEAIDYLNAFSSSDLLIQSRAYSLTGDAYMELEDVDNAISFYKKAATNQPTKEYTPRYLMKLAIAQEKKELLAEAVTTYDEIITKYSSSAESASAKKFKEYLQAKIDAK